MRVTMFLTGTDDSKKGFFPAAWRMRAKEAVSTLAAKLLVCAAPAFVVVSGGAVASPATPYSHMAPVDAYLMDRTKEIAFDRSAAPSSVSKDATILVLTRTGYETAVKGTNGFVCMVGRGFSGASDWPERWNPKILAAECQNPAAARSVMPIAKLRTAMILAGRTDAEILDRIETALSTKEIPPLEPGAMSYMMSKSSYLTDEGAVHDMPHVMFFVPVNDGASWGANASGSPLIGAGYWFLTPGHEVEAAKLPPLSVFLMEAATWSDGTPAPMHQM